MSEETKAMGKLVADDRDPDEIIRALRDRIDELEPSLCDWKDMAMNYRVVLELIITRNKLMNPVICLDMLEEHAKRVLGRA